MKLLNQRRLLFSAVFVLVLLSMPSLFAEEQGAHRDAFQFFQAYTIIRVWAAFVSGLAGLVLLVKFWLSRKLRLLLLGAVLFVFGVLSFLPLGNWVKGMAMHPSPMCMIEKPFMFLQAGQGIPIFFFGILSTVVLLNLIGNKLFCGWACPAGALQEILHRIPVRKVRVPFKISNGVRIGFFVLFLVVLFTAGISLYEYVSAFEFFHFTWAWLGILIIGVIAAASLFIFRPFCYFLCPMGLFSWLLEGVAIFRVQKVKDDCGGCKLCVEKSPCPAVAAIQEGKRCRPDCYACGECIEICPQNNLRFTCKK